MRKFVIAAAVVALAACSQAEQEPVAEATETAAVETVALVAADGNPSTGTFKVIDAEGKFFTQEVREDGTYTNMTEGEADQTGTWEQKSPAVFCTTKDEEGAEQECSDETIGDDGVWTSVDQKTGESHTIERVEA
ncbi:hypothetical protein [Qipengyuania zhejiangensis]|uniref:hypothetical protein n=1 Tax=Qipengyuania zhejiangensis TaxID=3077782 RepID=UPI002D7906B5|nr:hypothetical protein [Qipengyuania sp. Z2]